MKKSISLLLANILISYAVTNAQIVPSKIAVEEEKIDEKLLLNCKNNRLKDSIAVYTFAIKVTAEKKQTKTIIKKIETNDPLLSGKVLPGLDSLFKDIDFGVFIKGKGIREIIIPIAITINDYNGVKYPTKIDTEDVYNSFNKMFYYNENNFKYDYIFLSPKSFLMSKKVDW